MIPSSLLIATLAICVLVIGLCRAHQRGGAR